MSTVYYDGRYTCGCEFFTPALDGSCKDLTCSLHGSPVADYPFGKSFTKDDFVKKPEAVNHPQHYGGDTVYETIKVLQAWLPREQFIGFLRGNSIKYQSRLGKKGEAKEDAEKAEWYSQYLVKFLSETKE